MKVHKIYISVGLHGYDRDEQERIFRGYEDALNQMGWHAVVPMDIPAFHPDLNQPCPRSYAYHGGHSAACWLRGDLLEMLTCHAVLMIGEWERSVGAALVEHNMACATGMDIYYEIADVPNLHEKEKL